MEALEAIRTRRSIRRFKPGDIPREHLETIVDAGRLAASGNNVQPWDFIVVTERATIAEFKVTEAWVAQASAVIAVVIDPATRWWVEDGAAAIQNMLLAAAALGYGACWVEGDLLPYEDMVKSLLGVPAAKRLMALIPVGVPAVIPKPKKRALKDVLHWERY